MTAASVRSIITDDGWRVLLHTADVLIPEGAGRPNATAAPGYESQLAICLEARRDVVHEIAEVLAGLLEESDLESALRRMDVEQPDRLEILGNLAAAAYFMVPEVASTTGYVAPHRNPAAYDEAVDELATGILDPVIDRGPIYRVPDSG